MVAPARARIALDPRLPAELLQDTINRMPRFLRHVHLARLATVLVGAALLGGCAAGAPGDTLPPTPGQAVVVPTDVALSAQPTAVATVAMQPPTALPPAPTATAPAAEPTAAPTPRPQPPAPADPTRSEIVTGGESDRREIALTFDGGADRGNAVAILDLLAAYGVHGSFGITGEWATENPDLVARMAAEGHQIINHTWSHDSFTGYSTGEGTGLVDPQARIVELARTNEVIADATGGYDTRPWFRPPYGDLDDGVLVLLAAEGYTHTAMWTCDSLGWNGLTAAEIYERCVVTADPGDIILMHLGEGAPGDIDVLPRMIETLLADGYALVTVEQLVQP